MQLKVRVVLDQMLQRSEIKAMSAPTGGLGKYVNRLGFAVASEEQRNAALDRIIEYADTNNPQLAELAKTMRRATSFVYNPETAIDTALGGDLKINLIASNSDLLNAFMATKGNNITEAQAQQSVSSALYSLMANENMENAQEGLTSVALKAGFSKSEIENLINRKIR